MAACSKYKHRLKQALEYRGLEYPQKIIDVMGKRAKTDRSLDAIIHSITNILEPPVCHKGHCPHFTTYAFCNCSKKLVPGKCKLNLEYVKRQKEKDEKLLQKRIDLLPEKCKPVNEYTKGRIMGMSDSGFNEFLELNT